MLTVLFTIVIFLIPTFFVVSMDNTNANLFVSRDEMKKNLRSVLEPDLEYKFNRLVNRASIDESAKSISLELKGNTINDDNKI